MSDNECFALLETKGPVHCWSTPVDNSRTIDEISESTRKAIRNCINGKAKWPLVLTGDPGAGKTLAGLCMIDEYGGWYATLADLHGLTLIVREDGGLWYPAPTGLKATERDIWDDWCRKNLTVLDEIGKRGPTSSQDETLQRAIDLREGKPSVVISNVLMDGLRGIYGERIYSRLQRGTVLSLKGDRRQTPS